MRDSNGALVAWVRVVLALIAPAFVACACASAERSAERARGNLAGAQAPSAAQETPRSASSMASPAPDPVAAPATTDGTPSAAPETPSADALVRGAAPGEGRWSVERLPVEGHGDALLVVPLALSARPRGALAPVPVPVIVAAGGAGDTPEWECRAWAALVGEHAFVICVRGLPLNPRAPEPEQRYYFKSHLVLEREVFAALAALEARHGAAVDVREVVYAGFSQGATMGALVIRRYPARFSRAVLIEGGVYDWTDDAARAFHRGGGQRVLFACGQANCLPRARRSSDQLERAGVAARAVLGSGGHTYEDGVAERLRENLAWLLDGAPAWAARER